MSSLAWNIKRKMEWMGRNLRKIDDVAELINWASALRELNSVLKELDIKEYKDNWRPWIQRNKQGMKGGRTDQVESNDLYLLRQKMVTVPQVDLEESSGSDLMNNGERKWSRPPRVEVEGDDIERLAPKAAVMKMLNDAKELQENTLQERNKPNGELSLEVKIKNREIWRMGMLERLMKKKVPMGYWEDVGSGNFQGLIVFSAPHDIRMEVINDMGYKEVDEYLYKEMKRYYENGTSIEN